MPPPPTPPPPPPPLEAAPPRPLTPLSYLSSPVLDLAATLHTSADADQHNADFLRDSIDSSTSTTSSTSTSASRSRPHYDMSRDPRLANNRLGTARPADSNSSSSSQDDLSRRLRLQRVLARLNQIHDPTATTTSSASAYNRTPSPGRNNQYDWAPSQDPSATAVNQDENELDQILAELRHQHPDTSSTIPARLPNVNTNRTRDRNRDSHAPPSTDLADAAGVEDRQRRSLRSRAVLQRARQESSPSATERILRYAMQRSGAEVSQEEERARAAGWFNPASSTRTSGDQYRSGNSGRDSWPLPPSANDVRTRTMQERAEVMQRRYGGDNPPPRLPRISTPPVSSTATSSGSPQFLENALRYLNQLRSCYSYEQALSAAIDHGLATKEFFADKHDDFVMDLGEIEPISGSSWLQPGTIFEGHQHATNGNAGLLATRAGAASRSVEQINPNFRSQTAATATGFDHPPGSTRWIEQPVSAFQSLGGIPGPVQPTSASMLLTANKTLDPAHNHWPVRVIIHSIDAERMTLQGTMEAYDVPQHPHSLSISNAADPPKAGKKNAPITTYLEGHIIDLETHSFLTPSPKDHFLQGPHLTEPNNSTPYTSLSDAIAFPSANEKTDASNWRKLAPFNQHSGDEEMARVLLSKDRMSDVGKDYIFMRWKERCFVHGKGDTCSESERRGDQDRGHGLTISGFYYVSLRRSDGVVEGLYFDPTSTPSTPYQCLRLKGRSSGWGVVDFR